MADRRPSRVFLSAVSAEFGQYRDLLADRLSAEVIYQEEFKCVDTDTVEKLYREIAGCDVVVHFIGAGAGSIANEKAVDEFLQTCKAKGREFLPFIKEKYDLGREFLDRLTYTQWEAVLAIFLNKRFITLQTDGEVTDGNPPGKDPFQPNDADRTSLALHLDWLERRVRRPPKVIKREETGTFVNNCNRAINYFLIDREPEQPWEMDSSAAFNWLHPDVRKHFNSPTPPLCFYDNLESGRDGPFHEPQPTNLQGRGDEGHRQAIAELLVWNRRAIVTGPPGVGKSTLMHTLAREAALNGVEGREVLPILLSLSRFDVEATRFVQSAEWLANILDMSMVHRRKFIPAAIAWLEEWAMDGRLVILLDALDEGATAKLLMKLTEDVDRMSTWGSPFIVSCRTDQLSNNLGVAGLKRYDIVPPTTEQVRQYVRSFPHQSEEDAERIASNDIAKTWFWVQVLLLLEQRGGRELSSDAGKSTESVCRALLLHELKTSRARGLTDRNVAVHDLLGSIGLLRIFAGIAHAFVARNRGWDEARAVVERALTRFTNAEGQITTDDVLSVLTQARLIWHSFDDTIQLIHPDFARNLARSRPEDRVWISNPPETITARDLLKYIGDLQGVVDVRKEAVDHGKRYVYGLVGVLMLSTELPCGWDAPIQQLTDVARKPHQPWVAIVASVQLAMLLYRGDLRKGASPLEKIPRTFKALRSAEQVLADIDSDEHRFLTVDHHLFCEYVIGLGYFELLAQLGEELLRSDSPELVPDIAGRPEVSSGYGSGLDAVFDRHKRVLQSFNVLYGKSSKSNRDSSEVWVDIRMFLMGLDPEVRALADHAISMRFIPSEPSVVSLAQILHWQGWGGRSEVLAAAKDALAERRDKGEVKGSELLDVLIRHMDHYFDWFDQEKGGEEHFIKRRSLFGFAAVPLKSYAVRCTAALAVSHGLGFRDNQPVHIWGDAVGPLAIAEVSIARQIHDLLRHNDLPVEVHATLTDVSAPAVATLFRREELNPIRRRSIHFRDLNRDFQGEPGAPVLEKQQAVLENSVRIYSCSVALHQIADRTRGHKRLRRILSFATRVVEPGGVVSIPDVGTGAVSQVVLLPINAVDREGGWGLDVFTNTSIRRAPLRFAEVQYLTSEGRAKVPVPLIALAAGSPQSIAKDGFAMYEFIPYIVVELEISMIESLQHDWDAATSVDELARLGEQAVAEWRPTSRGWIDGVREQLQGVRRSIAHSIYDGVELGLHAAPEQVGSA